MARKSSETPAAANGAASEATPGRIAQMRMAAGMVHQANPRAIPMVIGAAVGTMAIVIIIGVVTGQVFLYPLGVLLGILVGMILFGRFAQAAQYSAIEGQPGAAAAVLQTMRGKWTVTPAIAANRNMDVVHRAVGRAGVVLAAEKKRVSRVAYEIPIYDFQVGEGEGQIPISKIQRKVMKLPRNLSASAVSDLNYRLKALPQTLQAPKGPMPMRGRQPKMPRPKTR
jgi:hypothetical protein